MVLAAPSCGRSLGSLGGGRAVLSCKGFMMFCLPASLMASGSGRGHSILVLLLNTHTHTHTDSIHVQYITVYRYIRKLRDIHICIYEGIKT